jgi:hypothetical protein
MEQEPRCINCGDLITGDGYGEWVHNGPNDDNWYYQCDPFARSPGAVATAEGRAFSDRNGV